MDMKAIVKSALAKFKMRPLEEYVKPTDDWVNLSQKIKPITMTAIKPTGTTSMLGNNTTGVAPISANVGHSISSNPYNITSSIYNTTYASGITMPQSSNSSISLYSSTSSKEIVRLNNDGTVTWANGVDVDEAAKAFSQSLSQGGELAAGITYAVKQRMRDAVFEEMIELATVKGTLTVDDLTYLHQAAKIMDKLKGIK